MFAELSAEDGVGGLVVAGGFGAPPAKGVVTAAELIGGVVVAVGPPRLADLCLAGVIGAGVAIGAELGTFVFIGGAGVCTGVVVAILCISASVRPDPFGLSERFLSA